MTHAPDSEIGFRPICGAEGPVSFVQRIRCVDCLRAVQQKRRERRALEAALAQVETTKRKRVRRIAAAMSRRSGDVK